MQILRQLNMQDGFLGHRRTEKKSKQLLRWAIEFRAARFLLVLQIVRADARGKLAIRGQKNGVTKTYMGFLDGMS